MNLQLNYGFAFFVIQVENYLNTQWKNKIKKQTNKQVNVQY